MAIDPTFFLTGICVAFAAFMIGLAWISETGNKRR